MSFDDRYEECLDEMTESVHKLCTVYADDQINQFTNFLGRNGFDANVLKELAEQFIRENRE